ncbi:MAG: hypothetical protein LBV08_01755 [Clostridiales bacterium]|nr:hypothetical protein [Clostridiales bacterium]
MDLGIDILLHKLKQYYNADITKKELGLWAMQSYYDLLQGGYIYIEKLKVYYFLKTLSTFHIMPNDIKDEFPCTADEVLNIYEVMCGRRNANYTFNLRINKKILHQEVEDSRKACLDKIYTSIFEHSSGSLLNSSKIFEIDEYAYKNIPNTNTLIDILESNIMSILIEHINVSDGIFDFNQTSGLYIGGRDTEPQEFTHSVLKLFSCIMGEKCFRICILYAQGICNLTLILP